MNASKELIITGILLVLGLMGGAYMASKGNTKILTQLIIQTTGQINTLRDMAGDYAQLNPTGDFQNISMEELKEKNILPTSMVVSGSGSDSKISSPYDTLQEVIILDPNESDASSRGKGFQISINSQNSKMTTAEKQIFEDKLKANFENSGGVVSAYENSGADGLIEVYFE